MAVKNFRLVVGACVCFTASVASAQDWTALHAKTKDSVFRLRAVLVSGAHEDVRLCSAVLVNASKQKVGPYEGPFVLTAAHCIHEQPHGRSLEVQNRHADVARVNYALDLAVLSVRGLQGTALVRRTTAVSVGLPIAALGSAFGTLQPSYAFGWVSAISNAELNVGVLADVMFVPGMSGGAVLDTEGRVVSIVQAFIKSGGQGFGIAATPKVVQDFTEDYWPAS